MTDRELLECLKDRPCDACKFHSDKGCSKWDCVFDSKRTIPRIRRDGCRDPLCSNCFEAVNENWNYCPHCGSQLEEAELEQEPCDKCEVGNPCLYCKHEFEPQERSDKE